MAEADTCGHGVSLDKDCRECTLVWYRGLLESAEKSAQRYREKIAELEADQGKAAR